MAVTRQMAHYQNRNSEPIELSIGSLPGKPWDRYDSRPGQIIEGPAGYAEKFQDAGYTLVPDEDMEYARLLAEELAPKSAPIPEQAQAASPEKDQRPSDGQRAPAKGRRADRSSTG